MTFKRLHFLLIRYPRRIEEFKLKGCAGNRHITNSDDKLCSFPTCFCYPEWQWEKGEKNEPRID